MKCGARASSVGKLGEFAAPPHVAVLVEKRLLIRCSRPVREVKGARQFYVDQVGFPLDVDYSPNDAFSVPGFARVREGCPIHSRQAPPAWI
jgi:hypothetical protein